MLRNLPFLHIFFLGIRGDAPCPSFPSYFLLGGYMGMLRVLPFLHIFFLVIRGDAPCPSFPSYFLLGGYLGMLRGLGFLHIFFLGDTWGCSVALVSFIFSSWGIPGDAPWPSFPSYFLLGGYLGMLRGLGFLHIFLLGDTWRCSVAFVSFIFSSWGYVGMLRVLRFLHIFFLGDTWGCSVRRKGVKTRVK